MKAVTGIALSLAVLAACGGKSGAQSAPASSVSAANGSNASATVSGAEHGVCAKIRTASTELDNAAAELAAANGVPSSQYLLDRSKAVNDLLKVTNSALALPSDSALRTRIAEYFKANPLPSSSVLDPTYGPLAKVFVGYCSAVGA